MAGGIGGVTLRFLKLHTTLPVHERPFASKAAVVNECPRPSHWETACGSVDFLVKKPPGTTSWAFFLRHPKTSNLLAYWEIFPKVTGSKINTDKKNMAINNPQFQYDLHLQSSVFETTTSHIITLQFTTSDNGDKLSLPMG